MRKSEFSKQQKYSENCVVHNCIKKTLVHQEKIRCSTVLRNNTNRTDNIKNIALRVSWKINKLVVTKRPNEKALIRGLVTVFICIL